MMRESRREGRGRGEGGGGRRDDSTVNEKDVPTRKNFIIS